MIMCASSELEKTTVPEGCVGTSLTKAAGLDVDEVVMATTETGGSEQVGNSNWPSIVR